MEGGRGGGGGGAGGRNPRGKKYRGSPRGRGQDSPVRTPATASSASESPVVQQSSPSVSSTLSPALSSSPARGGVRDEETKVAQHTPSPSVPSIKPVVEPTPTKSTVPTSTTPYQSQLKPNTMEDLTLTASIKEVSKDDVDKSAEALSSVEAGQAPEHVEKEKEPTTVESPPPPTITTLPSPVTPPATAKEDLEIAKPPTPPPQIQPSGIGAEKKVTIESRVEQALSKPQPPRQTAKTLVVSPPDETERSTDAPLSVEINPSSSTSPEAGTSSSQRQPRHSRSESLSPGYGYPLYGPVGKPGYIGGVGFSGDDEGDASTGEGGRPRSSRRESAIAAIETAVKGFSKRQWILLIIFGIIDLLSAITISLQAPFYPAEAERKGATATEYGLVFGIFEFIVFLTSPLFGKYMNKLGPKTVFSVCILVTSVSVICFGLLDRINDHTWFISLCFVCRIFEALGCAGFFTATFVIIALEFPESVATTFASLETFFGLGLIIGPTVGGALFEVGGFSLPFFVVGACLLATGILSGLVMPKIDRDIDVNGTEEKGFGIWTILKIPSVALVALSIASTSMSLGYVSATLEPHIRRFGLSPLQTGLVFIVNGGVYAITAPVFGLVCDYIRRPVYVTILGNLFIFISFLLIGPADFMPFDTILWVTIVGLVIQGVGFGCCLVSGFIVGLQDSMKHGLPDNMATYAVTSGLWTSALSFGAWVGPSAGGVLYDEIGFRGGSWLILVTSFISGVVILVHTCSICSQELSVSDSESEPLLSPIPPLLGQKDFEESQAVKPSTSYGSTSRAGDGAV